MASSKRAWPMRGLNHKLGPPRGQQGGIFLWHTSGGWAGGSGQGHNSAHLLHLLLPHLIIPCIIRYHCRKCFSYYAMPKKVYVEALAAHNWFLVCSLSFSLVCASLVQFFSVCSHSPEAPTLAALVLLQAQLTTHNGCFWRFLSKKYLRHISILGSNK